MTPEEIAQRLEKLERDNRRLKGFAIGVLAVAAALSAIYATQGVPEKITAHEFLVIDHSGKGRLMMGVGNSQAKNGDEIEWPMVGLLDATGKLEAGLGGSDGASLAFYNPQGNTTAQLGSPFSTGPYLELGSPQDQEALYMQVLSSGQPTLRLRDRDGFRMDLGYVEYVGTKIGAPTVKGHSSAASITMFGNDHLIWNAP